VKTYFGSFTARLLTCWQLTTFDSTTPVLWTVSDVSPIWVVLTMAFMIVLGMGVLNLVMGFMAESAVDVLVFQSHFHEQAEVTMFLTRLQRAQTLMINELGIKDISLEMLSIILGDAWNSVTALREGKKRKSVNAEHLQSPLVWKMAKKINDVSWGMHVELREMLQVAGIKYRTARQIFEKLDFAGTGTIRTADFIQGCIEMKDELLKANMYCLSQVVKQVWAHQQKAREGLHACHDILSRVLHQMHAAIHWKNWDDDISASHKHQAFSYSWIHNQAEQALKEMELSGSGKARYTNQGLMVLMVGSGRVKCENDGRDIISSGDGVRNYGGGKVSNTCDRTCFRSEVQAGDILILQQQDVTGDEPIKKCFQVRSVVNNDNLKVHPIEGPSPFGDCHFHIIRFLAQPRNHMSQPGTLAACEHPGLKMSPRSDQEVLEWQMITNRMLLNRGLELEKEYSDLKYQLQNGNSTLEMLDNQLLMAKGFKVFTKNYRDTAKKRHEKHNIALTDREDDSSLH